MKYMFLALFTCAALFSKAQDTTVAATITSAGWYRIAYNGPMVLNGTGGTRAAARFILRDVTTSWHQTTEFSAFIHYGSRPSIALLNNSYFSPIPVFTKIRIVEAGIYDGAALEVYVASENANVKAFIMDNIQVYGWTPVPWTLISTSSGDLDGVISGFFARVMNLTSVNTGYISATGSVLQFESGRVNINSPNASDGLLNIGTSSVAELAFTGSSAANIIAPTDLYLLPAAGGRLHLGAGGTNSRVIIDTVGNMIIGATDAKGYKLAVNGSAIFTKVKVKAFGAWPDYVFEDHYPLRSLRSLGEYIRSNKHLPDIPAAAEIHANGQDLGEINTQLLRKIEELTLYLLQHQKKIEALEQKVAQLERK